MLTPHRKQKGSTLNHSEPGRSETRDLTLILRHLAKQRGSAEAKQRLAHDEVTSLFLKAGIRALSENRAVTGPKIVKEAQKIDGEQGTHYAPNDAKFRDRWPFIDLYRSDLISYCLSWKHWSMHLDEDGELHGQLSRERGFYDAIQKVAYQDLEAILRNDFSKIPFIMALSAKPDSVDKDAVSATNRDLRTLWGSLCTQVITKRGLQLRPDVTVEELADLLVILADGVAFRALSDSGSGVIDHDNRESLLGTGAAAIVAGFLDPGDGKSLRQVLDDLGGDGDATDASRAG